jgi:hypothetical protein
MPPASFSAARYVAMLDGGDHQVLDVSASDAARHRHVTHRLAVATVEREGDTHLLAVVTK